MEKLLIQKYLETNGLEKTINDFSLKSKDYGHKVIIKYDQIGSDFSNDLVKEARGIILEKNTWKIMSWAFIRFFNYEEPSASKIDFKNSKIFKKEDGTMIQLYYDWITDEWCVGTTGTAEGEGEINNKLNTSFSSLFWETFKKNGGKKENLTIGLVYVFELMTPYNIVVTPHKFSKLSLLTVRSLDGNFELNEELFFEESLLINIKTVESYNFDVKNVGKLKSNFNTMDWTEEGYVVCDDKFNRIKLKNPAYVAVHHLKGKLGNHHIMEIIKTNEVDEFIVSFPEREEEILNLQKSFKDFDSKLNKCWGELKLLKPKNITKKEQKKFAENVFLICEKYDIKKFSGLFFGLNNYKIESIEDYLSKLDNKLLYNFLNEYK